MFLASTITANAAISDLNDLFTALLKIETKNDFVYIGNRANLSTHYKSGPSNPLDKSSCL